MLQAAKTAIAAALSWYIAADVIGNTLPVFAPLTAVLTVQVTVWDSVSRGLQRAVGVVIGVLLAFGIARLLGVHVWSVALVVFVSWMAGMVLRLGQQGAVQVPVSALLVLVLGATVSEYAEDRVVDTILGAAVGILVSFVVIPRTNLAKTQARVRGLAASMTAALRDIGARLQEPGADFSALLHTARQLDDDAGRVAVAVERTETATRWSPTGHRDRPAAEVLVGGLNSLDMVGRAIRGIARVLADMPPGSRLPPEVAGPVAELLSAVAGEIDAWANEVTSGSSVSAPASDEAGVTAKNVADHYHKVLLAARSGGIDADMTAAADAVAIVGLRISDDLRAEPDLRPPERPSWRSLLGG